MEFVHCRLPQGIQALETQISLSRKVGLPTKGKTMKSPDGFHIQKNMNT